MAVVAKMVAQQVASYGGLVWEPCGPDEDGAKTAHEADTFGLRSYYGRPSWVPDSTHYRQVQGTRQVQVTLNAVSAKGEDDPNREWAEATPIGSVALTIANPGAWKEFECGAEYRVTIQKVRAPRKAGED